VKVSYDSGDDIIYMPFKDGPAEVVKEVEANVIVELDKKVEVMGIELWSAKKRGALRQLAKVAVTR